VRATGLHITDIEEFQVLGIILQVNNIAVRSASVRGTRAIWTLHRLQVRQSRVLPGKLVQDNLVRLTDALLDIDLRHETPFCRLV